MAEPNSELTQLLINYGNGDENALSQLLPQIYNELRKISRKYLRNEYRNHTLQTTELVHEAYIKLIGSQNLSWQNKAHFFGIAAQSMRQVLVDYARKKKSIKRGEGKKHISLDEAYEVSEKNDTKILALDEALKRLEKVEERSSKIVELRYFSGLTFEETAEVLNISESTAKRGWNYAKAWLYREMDTI